MAEQIKMTYLLRFFTFYVNNLILCILPKCVMRVTSDQFSDTFDNGWKKQNGRFIEIFLIVRNNLTLWAR